MKEKISHLSKDLQEFFPKNSGAEVGKKLEQIKKLQQDFSVTSGFKTSLKSRLKNIYSIDNTPIITKFSWFQYAGIFSSFIFVSCMGYAFYATQQQNMEDILTSQKIEENTTGGAMMSDMMMSENTAVQDVEKEENEIVHSQQTSLQPIPENSETISSKNIPLAPKTSQKKSHVFSSEDVSQESIPEGNTSDAQSDTTSSSSLEDSSQSPSEDNITMMIQSSVMMDETSPSEGGGDTSGSVSEMRMMDTSVPDRFHQLCESYSGSVSVDDSTCQFQAGKSCSRENLLSENPELCEFLIQETHNTDSEK